MCRLVFLTFAVLLFSIECAAQSSDEMMKILTIIGAADPEDADPYEVERIAEFLDRPLRLNSASPSRLSSSGLFTQYQVASLLDYRRRHGDIMSFEELSSIDGFSGDRTDILIPFISLEGADLKVDTRKKIENDLAVKGGVKQSGAENTGSYGIKYRFSYDDKVSLAFAISSSDISSSMTPKAYSGFLSIYSHKLSTKVVLGDFNARFGQGLSLWTGMTMSGFSTLQSFYRTTSGLSSSWSYTGSSSMTGVASETNFRRLTLTMLFACPELKSKGLVSDESTCLPALNLIWRGRNLSVSFTHYSELLPSLQEGSVIMTDMKTSGDISLCVNGVDSFTELSYDWSCNSIAAVSSVLFPLGNDSRMAVNLRYYPSSYSSTRSAAPRASSRCSNEYGLASCWTLSTGKWITQVGFSEVSTSVRRCCANVSADISYYPIPKDQRMESLQVKASADLKYNFSESWSFDIRVRERFRTWGTMFCTDVRTDLSYFLSHLVFNARANVLKSKAVSALGYLEAGCRFPMLSAYWRIGAFAVDNWDDRIYVYERDAPGSFSVPAFYGRGIWLSLTATWKYARWGRLYARLSSTSYPFMPYEKKKPGKAELKLQSVISF